MAKSKKKKKHISRKIVILLIIVVALFIALCFVTPTESEVLSAGTGDIPGLELPKPIKG